MGKKFRGGVLRKVDKSVRILIAEIIILISICLLHSLSVAHYVDFYPINGTFQNFNPVRRLLDGQVPYKDFQDYLGMGHLYTGAIFTELFGGNFQSSLMAFSFLTLLCLALLAVMIGSVIFKKKEVSLLFADILLLFLVIQPLLFKNMLAGTEDVLNALNLALSPGNSARFVRGMILPITYFLFLLGSKIYMIVAEKRPKIVKKKKIIAIGGVSLISGFAFSWSNDYGISCWACLAVMTFTVIWIREKNLFRAFTGMIIEIFLSALALFIFVEIFTWGHIFNWVQSIFGTGGYQAWYYNSRSYYLYDVDCYWLMLLQAFLCIAYLIKLFRHSGSKSAVLRYGTLAYANMVGFCAANEYKLISGNANREIALSILFLSVLFEICRYIWFSVKKHDRKIIMAGTFLIGFSWICSSMISEAVFWKVSSKDGTYIAQLGGYLTSYASDLSEASEFLKGESFFATYASAQEVVEGKYQPSGIDYIIHVLGDNARKNYLDTFRKRNFRYAATIEEDYTPYTYWIKSANWFFYQELYKEWHPVYSNTYETYWERNKEDEKHILTGNCSVSVVDIDHAVKKIVVQTAASVNGVANVYIDYAVKKGDGKNAKLIFQTMMRVENSGTVYTNAENAASWESNYLRPVSKEYIPVTVVDGYGEVTLTSCPERDTNLELYVAECSEIFTVEFDYIRAYEVTDYEDRTVISVKKNAKTDKILENMKEIILGKKRYCVSEVQSDDSYSCLVIKTEGTPLNQEGNILKNGNMIGIVR